MTNLSFYKNFNSPTVSNSSLNCKICRICHVQEKSSNKSSPYLKCSSVNVNTSSMEKGADWLLSLKCFFRSSHHQQPDHHEQDSLDLDDEMIAPCECRGTMRHVHRGCLNQWRTSSPRADSFQRCEQCFAVYKFKNSWISSFFLNSYFIVTSTIILFGSWIIASTFITTNGFAPDSSALFNLMPTIYLNKSSNFLWTILFQSQWMRTFIYFYNDVMESGNRLLYGLIFVALTEYIFFTPSFILSFNTLFCIWRIQRYEIFFDKWLLLAFTGFGLYRAVRSIHEMISSFITRIVKLKLLQVVDRDKKNK